MNKAFFLDRDGVINIEKKYLYLSKDFEFIDGIFDLCHAAVQAGYCLIIVTNQSGIARGYYTEQQFQELMSWVVNEFKKQNLTILDVFYCPHHGEHGKGKYQIECCCRKPQPQMLLDAAKKHHLDLSESILAGDKVSDISAGKAAHLGKTALVGTGHFLSETDQKSADIFANSLDELREILFPSSVENKS